MFTQVLKDRASIRDSSSHDGSQVQYWNSSDSRTSTSAERFEGHFLTPRRPETTDLNKYCLLSDCGLWSEVSGEGKEALGFASTLNSSDTETKIEVLSQPVVMMMIRFHVHMNIDEDLDRPRHNS